jgi:prolycopene isomerase
MNSNRYDVVIIGAGVGGLTAGAILARSGKKVLILEKNPIAGGYAVNFKRNGFEFDASLHLMNAGNNSPVQEIFKKCGIIEEVEFIKPKYLYRSIYPDFDISIPQCNTKEFITLLCDLFPNEKQKINDLIKSIVDFFNDAQHFRDTFKERVWPTFLPFQYRSLNYYLHRSWGDILDKFLQDQRLKAILSQLWPFFGLPPETLSAYYFAAPTFDYIANGGYYPRGGSESVSSALLKIIEFNGGRVQMNATVEEIIAQDKLAKGVRLSSGDTILSDTVISNISAHVTFCKLLKNIKLPFRFYVSLKRMKPSVSAFQVYLGLNVSLKERNLFNEEYELFVNPGYDIMKQYQACIKNDMNSVPFAITFYSNLLDDVAPPNKSTITITVLSGYKFWENLPKEDYEYTKNQLAGVLIRRAEKIIPNLSGYIEIKDIATPLTMEKYTGCYKGAIYGWEENLSQSGIKRMNFVTPIKNLYLVGAWTQPGGGLAGVMQSGEKVAEYLLKLTKV